MEFYYNTPAGSWIDGLPIGNGKMAAMVQETDTLDEITINQEWVWASGKRERTAEKNAKYLPFVRRFFEEGQHYEGAIATNIFYSGEYDIILDKPARLQRPAMACNVIFDYICEKNEYVGRRLNLEKGYATIERNIDGVMVQSRYYADCIGGLLHFSWNCDKSFSGELILERCPVWDAGYQARCEDEFCRLNPLVKKENLMILSGVTKDDFGKETVAFKNKLAYKTDGEISNTVRGIKVKNATYLYVTVNTAVDIDLGEIKDDSIICEVPQCPQKAFEAHQARFSEIMGRIDFELGGKDAALDTLTTDDRVKRMQDGNTDNGVDEMYFNFGRYLMVSATVLAELPTHLQGKWNNMIQPPWDSDYHLDINIQMNYWAAEAINMPEAAKGLIKFLNGIKEKGKENAQNLYGCNGILFPLSLDVWGGYYGVYGWTAWTGAAAWLAQHIWWHYIYSGDKEFLKNDAYDYFCQVAAFYEDYLFKGEDEKYHICPSYSPENPIADQPTLPVGICSDCSMDLQLIYDSLTYVIESSEILGVDAEKREKWQEIRDNLSEFKIGSDGRLMEWNEEYKEAEPGHRHLSHLYGIYPSDLFTPERNVKQYQAAKKSLDYRMEQGGGHTGWSRAWCACLFARLRDKDSFYSHYTALIKDFAAQTLLDLHPPGVFQIDGNFGGVAAVVEAIVGFYDGKAHILPALPSAWKEGKMCGIRLPGGHIVDVYWSDEKAQKLDVTIGFENALCLEYNGKEFNVGGASGDKITLEF